MILSELTSEERPGNHLKRQEQQRRELLTYIPDAEHVVEVLGFTYADLRLLAVLLEMAVAFPTTPAGQSCRRRCRGDPIIARAIIGPIWSGRHCC